MTRLLSRLPTITPGPSSGSTPPIATAGADSLTTAAQRAIGSNKRVPPITNAAATINHQSDPRAGNETGIAARGAKSAGDHTTDTSQPVARWAQNCRMTGESKWIRHTGYLVAQTKASIHASLGYAVPVAASFRLRP